MAAKIRVCPKCRGHNSECPHCGGGGADDARRGLNVIGSRVKPLSEGLSTAQYAKRVAQNMLAKKLAEKDAEHKNAEVLKSHRSEEAERVKKVLEQLKSDRLLKKEQAEKRRKQKELEWLERNKEAKKNYEKPKRARLDRSVYLSEGSEKFERVAPTGIPDRQDTRERQNQISREVYEETIGEGRELYTIASKRRQLAQFGRIVDGSEPLEKPLNWWEKIIKFFIR